MRLGDERALAGGDRHRVYRCRVFGGPSSAPSSVIIIEKADVLARTSQDMGHREAVGRTAQAMATRFRERWSLAVTALPYYPVFQ